MLHIRPRRLAGMVILALLAGALAALPALSANHAGKAKTQLIVLADDVAPGLDPDGTTGASPAYIEAIQNLLDPLVDYPSIRQGEVLTLNYKVNAQQFEPRLATSWSKKGLVWTMKLRSNVTSCAGNPLTADDVVYTFARAKSVSGASPVAWFLGNVAGILPLDPLISKDPAAKKLKGEVVKIDEHTVQFTQLHPNDLFPRVLQIEALLIWDSVDMKKHATAKDPWSHNYTQTVNAPGFGPYCLSKWIKGSEMDFKANPKYYRGQPQFTDIVLRKVPSNSSRIASLLAGSADIATNLTPVESASIAKSGKAKILSWKNNKVTALGLNFKFAPWSDKNNRLIRQAVAYALPYDEILKSDYLGTATKWNGPCESTYYGAVPDTRYTTNIAKAKALLAQAGYPDGKGLPKEGLVLNYVAERRALLEPIANRIRTALAKIGMNITLSPLSQTEYADRALTKHDAQMYLSDADRPLGPDVGYCALLWYVSQAKGGLVTGDNYSNPAFDALYAKSSTTLGATRLAVMKQMQNMLMTDLPKIPIAEVESQLAVANNITNWKGMGLDGLSFWEFKTTA